MVKSRDYEHYMRLALALAAEAAENGEIPVGCVIVDGEGAVVGAGRNRREETRSVTGHAELEALESACRARGDWRLADCTAFVTLEPCPMCAGALLNARLGTLVYGAREPETGEEERERILEALRASGGKKARAAALLRMDRTTLWRKLRKYGIE